MLCRQALPLLLQLLRLAVGVELSSHSTALTPHGDLVGSPDGQAPIMRTDRPPTDVVVGQAHDRPTAVQMLDSGAMRAFPREDTAPTAGHGMHQSGLSRFETLTPAAALLAGAQLEEITPASRVHHHLPDLSGATSMSRSRSSPSSGSGVKVPQHWQNNPNPETKIDGFQDPEDEDGLQKTERGYEWKQDHEERDESNDDDWDDEDTRDASGDGDSSGLKDTYDADSDPTNVSDGSYDDDGSAYDASDMPMVNVTAEEDATTSANTGPLKATNPITPAAVPPENDVEKLGEGIGAMAYERSPTGSRSINYELRKRLQLQDLATIILLVAAFGATIILSCCSVYQVAEDRSPAAYYSQPKNYQQRVICETNDVDAFLAAFNTQPQNVRLRITGKNPEPGGFRRFLRTLNAHTTRPRGLAALLPMRQRRRLSILFDVSLDLTPFITGDGRVSDDNLAILQNYLNTSNHLESVLIRKHVDWPLWEDVATNIRQRLRTLGFPGDVEVRFEAQDEILVYQNHKWSNFVRNRVTQALVVISIVGSAFWLPYVWVRSKTRKVETRFRINVDPQRYWDLVADGLSAAEGFQSM